MERVEKVSNKTIPNRLSKLALSGAVANKIRSTTVRLTKWLDLIFQDTIQCFLNVVKVFRETFNFITECNSASENMSITQAERNVLKLHHYSSSEFPIIQARLA